MRTRLLVIGAIVTVVLLAGARPSGAQQNQFGVRGGFSGSPDQFFVGAHVEPIARWHATSFRPNVEVGFGDDITLIAVNLELAHWMPITRTPWSVYAGGGVGANFRFTDFEGDRVLGGGLNMMIGLQHEKGIYAEIKIGMEPRVKITAGYILHAQVGPAGSIGTPIHPGHAKPSLEFHVRRTTDPMTVAVVLQ